jgi:membrane dipeptidase
LVGTVREADAGAVKRIGWLVAAILAVALGALVTVVAPIVDGRMNRVAPGLLPPVSAEASRLHGTLAVADLHGDLLLWPRSLLDRGRRGHTDLPRLREGRVALQVFSSPTQTPRGLNYLRNDSTTDQIRLLAIASRWPVRTWTSRLERSLHHAAKLDRAVAAANGGLVPIGSVAALTRFLAERASRPDRVGVLLSIEGLHASEGTIANLARLVQAGYRMMGLVHFFDNQLGGSSAGVAKGGLTAFGREAVRWMDEHRVVIDLAHASPATIDDVLALSTRPMVVSHTGVQGTCPGPRNLSDDQLRRIAATGGVIGIGFWEGAVCGIAPDTIAAAIRHAVTVAGIDHVGLGSDFDGATVTAFDASGLALVTDALLRRGFTDEEIRKIMGGNTVRLLMEALPPS